MNYEAIRIAAAGKIRQSGKRVTWRTSTAGTFDPVTGLTTGAAASDMTLYAVETFFSQADIDGTVVLQGDRRFMLAAVDLTGAAIAQPSAGDKLIVSSSTLSVVAVKPLAPGDVAVFYEVHCRG